MIEYFKSCTQFIPFFFLRGWNFSITILNRIMACLIIKSQIVRESERVKNILFGSKILGKAKFHKPIKSMNHKCGGGNIISDQFSTEIRIKCGFLCGTKKKVLFHFYARRGMCVHAHKKRSSTYKKVMNQPTQRGFFSIH